ncbi:hypothetical protein YC2023_039483 [Brassica napus]
MGVGVFGYGVKWPNCTHPFGCGPPNLTSLLESCHWNWGPLTQWSKTFFS